VSSSQLHKFLTHSSVGENFGRIYFELTRFHIATLRPGNRPKLPSVPCAEWVLLRHLAFLPTLANTD